MHRVMILAVAKVVAKSKANEALSQVESKTTGFPCTPTVAFIFRSMTGTLPILFWGIKPSHARLTATR